MIKRVGRLVRVELLKLSAHPFLYVALFILAAATILSALFQPVFAGQQETVWRPFNAIQLFAYGFQFGLRIATYVLLIFSAMMFAGEFDRGTIKNLLTRPVTRTDFFTAKAVTVVLLAVFLYVFVLYIALAWGLARGDLGPVWADDQYIMVRGYDEILAFAQKAVLMSFLPFLTVGFLGLLVSNWTESSGYAVAIALVLYLAAGIIVGMLSPQVQQNVFFHYAAYPLEKLRLYAQGGTEYWNAGIEKGLLYLKVPLVYLAGFIPPAYLIFLRRNIHA